MNVKELLESDITKKYILPGSNGVAATYLASKLMNSHKKSKNYVVPGTIGGVVGISQFYRGLVNTPEGENLILKFKSPEYLREDFRVTKLKNPFAPTYIIAGAATGALLGKMFKQKKGVEKSAGVLSALAERIGPKLLEHPLYKPLNYLLGSKETVNAIRGSKILKPEIAETMAKKMETMLPSAQREAIHNPSLQNFLKNKESNRLRDYAADKGWFKGTGNYLKNEVLHGEGTGISNFKNNYSSQRFGLDHEGNLFRKSKLSGISGNTMGLGFDAYMVGSGLFGKLKPGETRQGKLLNNVGFVYGQGSARKGLAGAIRGTAMGAMGQKLGDTIGTPKLPKVPQAPEIPNQVESFNQ